MTGYNKLREKALHMLRTQLPDNLYYHGIHHTLEVMKICDDYLRREKITGRDAKLLRLGALLHDIGFTVSNKNHEDHGVEIARRLMEEFGFEKKDFKVVRGLILATKIPQQPKTKCERILCDADLDYLGKNNFDAISDTLLRELKSLGIIRDKTEWDVVQVKFLEAHQYHTRYACKHLQPSKQDHLQALKEKVESRALG